MKIAFPFNHFTGGFQKSIVRNLDKSEFDTYVATKYSSSWRNKLLRRVPITRIKERAEFNKENDYNENLTRQIVAFKPDIFFVISGSGLLPHYVNRIKEEACCKIVTWVADNPCDPDPTKDKYFGLSLKNCDIFLNPEPVWDKFINNWIDDPCIIRFYGGYDPENYFPVDKQSITKQDIDELGCEISFTGGSYGMSPEGHYRSGILGQLEEFNLKIWGDTRWKYRYQFYPSLINAYQSSKLPYDKLRKLYTLCKVNINMPSPQILTSFQPRVFEIAATKGFQLIDHSNELYNVFRKDLVVTFKSLKELKDKVHYFLKNEKERKEIAEEMYKIVNQKYSWGNQISQVFRNLRN